MSDLREPKIITELPGPKSRELLKMRKENVPPGVSNTVPLHIKRGEGALFEDVDGNIFLDFAGGIGVLNVGHSHPEVIEAIIEQSKKFLHTSNVVLYEEYAKLAEKLNQIIPGDFRKKTMLVNSGAEAVENAVKIARKHTKRTEVITFTGAFHGRTLLTMTMTSKVKPYKLGFGPYAQGITRIPFPYCYRCPYGLERASCNLHCAKRFEALFLEEVAPEEVAAIIIEPIQGEGGFIIPPDDYIKELREICDKHGIMLIADEVQSSYCRTGKMYATEYWQEFGVYPDIVITAKSIAGGLPLSTVTGRAEIMDAPQIGGIGGTYSGNPVAASAALKVVEILERDRIAEKSIEIGKICMNRLEEMQEKYDLIGDVRGKGAMVGIEFVKDRKTKEAAKEETVKIAEECFKNGLIVLSTGVRGNVIRFLMPLVITEHQLNLGLDILEKAIDKISSNPLASSEA